MKAWVETWGPLITLVSTVGLLGVTAWYAVLTRTLAKSSAASAESAQSAAESAARSVAAQVASVNVRFDVAPRYAADSLHTHQVFAGVTVTCAASTVFVHGCRLESLSLYDGDPPIDASKGTGTTLVGGDDHTLPIRLHRGESTEFALPNGRSIEEDVMGFTVNVLYSIDGVAPIVGRTAEHYSPSVY